MTPHQFLKLVQYSRALFTGCGYSAIEEPAQLHVPTFMIPEQNGSNPPTLLDLRDQGHPVQFNMMVTAHMRHFTDSFGKYGIAEMYNEVYRLLQSESYAALGEAQLSAFETMLDDDEARSAIICQQYETIASMMGGFNGAAEIYDDFLAPHLGRRANA